METVFVIKHLKKGEWVYLSNHPREERSWDPDLYFAKQFISYTEAEEFFKTKCEKEHWGGYYQIEKYFVNGR